MRELRNLEVEERAAVARPAPAHAGPAQARLQDAEGQDLEILVVRARFLAGKAATALLLCERTFPGRAVAHVFFRLGFLSRRLCVRFTTSRTFTSRAWTIRRWRATTVQELATRTGRTLIVHRRLPELYGPRS